MKYAALAVTVCMAAPLASLSQAFAQREAVSSSLSPEAAAAAFSEAVTGACIPAVVSPTGMGGLPAAVKARLSPTNDITTRAQAGAATDEVVWDVNAARGVVTIHEKKGRCVVSVYGPPAMSSIMGLAEALSSNSGFERLAAAPPPNGYGQTLMKMDNGKRVMVQLAGSEPGMPGHRSRFSVITATVFSGS
jgi:hypothetical protein